MEIKESDCNARGFVDETHAAAGNRACYTVFSVF